MNLIISRLIGTLKSTFSIGKLTLDSGGVIAPHTITLPNETGVMALIGHITEGTGIDQIQIITVPILLTTEWQNSGITGSTLITGTYLLQMYANDTGSGGTNSQEYYSGILSWYSGETSSSLLIPTDEIVLHRAGHSGFGGLYLRTYRDDGGSLQLQISSNSENTSLANYIFRFRRMI